MSYRIGLALGISRAIPRRIFLRGVSPWALSVAEILSTLVMIVHGLMASGCHIKRPCI